MQNYLWSILDTCGTCCALVSSTGERSRETDLGDPGQELVGTDA